MSCSKPQEHQCFICFETPAEVWLVQTKMELLLLLTMACFKYHITTQYACNQMYRRNHTYCPHHIFEAATELVEIVELGAKGQMSTMGVRIVEIMAGNVLGGDVKPGTLDKAIHTFLRNFRTPYDDFVCDSYEDCELIHTPTHRCLQCGEDNVTTSTTFFSRPHNKRAFAVFAGPSHAKLMSTAQIRAAVAIPSITLCTHHLEGHAWTMKQLEVMLLDEEFEEKFLNELKEIFIDDKGWFNTMKTVYCCLTTNLPKRMLLNPVCKICKEDKSRSCIQHDQLLGFAAHWFCFEKIAIDIQWDLKRTVLEDNHYKIKVPELEEFEKWDGYELSQLLNVWRSYFGHQHRRSESEERVRVLLFLAKYWRFNLKDRIKEELIRLGEIVDGAAVEATPKTPSYVSKTPSYY
ncbi:hypothetical protein GCK72_006811 [Caenorhabditis remanei]|uniref:Lin-15A/B-like domain-containing protein n=1 Tax=Caenorhabditis remanei TaxID=31234 RepID=A0A6A5HKD6_CAERE|nr:hypothetical protein GCK72_006811 [Caenorhabditis remanei]KAF1766853.1 hypothetical protein GCK72_006811 [Caenorhabditis remanei]